MGLSQIFRDGVSGPASDARTRGMKRVGVIGVSLTLLLAGCGGSSASSITTVTATSRPPAASDAAAPAPRGLLSDEALWNQTFTTATVRECIAQGFDGHMGSDRAWRLHGGALACVSDPSVGVWGDRIINASLYFEPPVDAQAALVATSSLLPSDSRQVGSVQQPNLDWSIYREGSCQYVKFASETLAEAVRQAEPSWNGPRDRADIKLYSGNAVIPDGADQPYRRESIHVATIGIGDGETNPGC
jgi:hypothetical protein